MIQEVKPDYIIKVGIKNKEIVLIDWGIDFPSEHDTDKHVIKEVKKYLKKAIKVLK
jgi:hypothetical protein